jgi:hypothetical protein
VLLHAIVFLSGLLVGWNVLPQPDWVRDGYYRVTTRIKELFEKNS